MVLLGDEAEVEAHVGAFGDSGNLDVDRCMVCAEGTIGSEIILGAPDGTPRSRGSCAISFGPFGDGVSVSARQVHGLRQTYHRLRYLLGRTRWYS